ncbi:hypothetical protein ID866_9689 [Astraeus odoratus]|nr:hypothetical protein ID866_9689 [Astraeus odoratus]
MPVRAYTFKVELLGSRAPVITRTFSIPAAWTFRKLHAAIQYTFGWQHCHLHYFMFEPPRRPQPPEERGLFSFEIREQLLEVHMGTPEDEYDEGIIRSNFRISENEIRLCDVWDERGRYRQHAMKEGRLGECYYLYDFGDNWEHQVTFVSSTTLESDTLKVVEVRGAGALDDAGGVTGWEDVKAAFAATNPTADENERRGWARLISGRGGAYDPTVAPTVDELNAREGFHSWLVRAGFTDDHNADEREESARQGTRIARPNVTSRETPSYPAMPEPGVVVFGRWGPPIQCTDAERRFKTHSAETHPLDLFTPAINTCTIRAPRFVHTDNTHTASILVYTDGAAVNENTPDGRAGCGIYFVPDSNGISVPLENVPGCTRTANRAELRAAVAALKVRYWPGEGFKRIVIGASSEYVVKGACEWATAWRERGWRTSRGVAVKNRDLWEKLFEEIREYECTGVRVQFYLLKREWNTVARRCAMEGAVSEIFFVVVVGPTSRSSTDAMSDSIRPPAPDAGPRVLKIIVISDYICAFCYIFNKVLYDAIEACQDLPIRFDVEFRPFTLLCVNSPYVDKKGSRKEYLLKKFGEQAETKSKLVYEWAQRVGLELAEDGVVCRTNLAHRLAAKAYLVGGTEMQKELNDIIFREALAEGNDITDIDFLVDAAVEIGLMNREKALEFLRSTECQDCVDKMVNAARANGVAGVPFIIIDGKWALNGVQPKECYVQIFRKLALSQMPPTPIGLTEYTGPSQPPCSR